MPVPVVLGVIDRLARYHFNVLHWHLTEDQGWRLEVPRYPLLTQVGAYRTLGDGRRTGGFYSEQDVREIVAYAAVKGITVVPEIEMPGHCHPPPAAEPSPRRPDCGAQGLVDGRRGSQIFTDGLWAGFEGVDFDAIINLGEVRQVSGIDAGFRQDAGSWIFTDEIAVR